ncbi:hypothetical protein [Streptomyces hygroscopicus]|nr:hypothetical protein [Streptomyces hygroscopicus]
MSARELTVVQQRSPGEPASRPHRAGVIPSLALAGNGYSKGE